MKKVLFALFIIILFLCGCVKQPVTPEPEELEKPEEEIEEPLKVIPEPIPKPSEGTLSLFVSDAENVISDFDSLEVTFSLIKIYKFKDSAPVERSINVVADLTELQGSNALKLADLGLEPGVYSKVKLYASKIKGVLLGNELEVVIPGDALTVDKHFEVSSGEKKSFVVDLEVVKTGKITTTTGLERYKLQTLPLKSGTVPADVTYIKEITAAKMFALINEKAGKKYDRRVFMTQEAGFTPPKIAVEVGTKVIWENKDTRQLGIIMEGVFDRMVRGGGSYEYTFKRAGVYPYNMKYYVSNKGEITVVLPEKKEEKVEPLTPQTIQIRSDGFSPAEVSVKRGTKVTFVNNDTVHHHLVISGDPLTHDLAPDNIYSTTFNSLGDFSFYDAYKVAAYSGKVTVIS